MEGGDLGLEECSLGGETRGGGSQFDGRSEKRRRNQFENRIAQLWKASRVDTRAGAKVSVLLVAPRGGQVTFLHFGAEPEQELRRSGAGCNDPSDA